jgi:hypothetical protein
MGARTDTIPDENDESLECQPYVGQFFVQGISILEFLLGEQPTIWEVKRLEWLDAEYDPEIEEWLDAELLIHLENVLDSGDTWMINWLDLDELDPFPT